MAMERDLPANIVDRVRASLRELQSEIEPERTLAAGGEPAPRAEAEEPMGGESPCMAPLFEDW